MIQKPSGPVPTAHVEARHGMSTMSRGSRGFSFRELEGSGIAMLTARRWGLPMDLRRRSVLDSNVEALKNWYSKAKRVQQPTAGRRIEEELEKIGGEVEREVKKGATKAKKEATKVAKGAKKAEKEVEEEVEKVVKPRRGTKEKKPKAKPKDRSKID